MLEHVSHLGDFVDSTWRLCTSVSAWVCSLVSRNILNQVSLPSRSPFSDLVDGSKRQYSILMASTDPIDISSSDSDLEIEDGRNSNTSNVPQSATSRILPSWANTHGTNSRSADYGWKSKKVPSPERANTSNGSSSHFKVLSKSKHQMIPGSSGDSGSSKSFLGTINSRIANGSSTNFEKLSSQQAFTRTFPSTIQGHERTKSNNLVDNASSSYQLAERSITEGYMKDYNLKGNSADNMMYERPGARILPPSLMHGKSISSAQFGAPNDPVYHHGLAEERAAGSDERLIYQAALEDLNQPKVEADLPNGLLSVPLLRHQKIALAWMLQKETRSLHCLGGILADDQGLGKTISIIALVQMQRSLQSKVKNENSSKGKTEALNLDDDEDDMDKAKQNGESNDVELVPEVSTSKREFSRQRPAAGTLVVCPASVVRQWARELDDKVAEEAKLSVLVYHGGNRTRDPVELSKYDVVVTTYAIVTNEVPKQPLVEEDEDEGNREGYGLSSDFSFSKKRKKAATVGKRGKKGKKGNDSTSLDCGSGPLAKVGWFRVVLDEAQTIKNHRTQVARACCSLRAKRRWCLSGTPIQNAIDDLYSYFRFLRYDPYAVYKSFYSTIKIPISRNSLHGYKKLQAVLRAVMLRRTKGTLIDGQPIINLPPKTICLTKVDFSKAERTFYSKLHADSLSKFKAYAQAGTVNQNYANILLMLLRLRQACDHPLLVEGFNSGSVGKLSEEMAKRLPRDMLIDLLNRLETSSSICEKCSDPPDDPVVTMCGHVFCYQCVSDIMNGDENTCSGPECKEQLGSDVVFSKVTLRSCLSDDVDVSPSESLFKEKLMILQNDYVSSKIKALLEILQSICESNGVQSKQNGESSEDVTVVKYTTVYSKSPTEGPVKAIIFSQWTRMLDLVEYSLNQYCISYRRLDGTMSLASRDRAVKDFNNDPEITVMLMSLKAGNLGLNMVAACHVILLDLWWNPTTEDQAVDRAHRIGQTRPVTVTRITIRDTVEDRILNLQEEKRKMVASAFGEDQGGGTATRLTVEDLKYLFMF